ncbi:COG0535 Predicted Fe-S oxidoreductases [uncultured Caudovirales phage]|uniref:COG0535 Predicted Fe-S oxidoreductases n=1 Tax=uncultured Caudovirales phage TaxID=2100421 RepID=A0A6J5LDY8_9CAUD|nr:COG0535 Predicted Fe-S oxidoreductases [uncultured Caudovirales phage]CAB4134899.1 COG0535 Predicted Fe-S oxidoreductases [uncultured Caudovirales phage]
MLRSSLYWDAFEKRAEETSRCLKTGIPVPVRRVAIFVTDRCNLRCKYCSMTTIGHTMSKERFVDIVGRHKDAIIHITGGEPSTVPWLYSTLALQEGNFHLNTNAVIEPPYWHVQRLKVSLDSHIPDEWDELVGVKGAFNKVVSNVQKSIDKTVTSITCLMSSKNFRQLPAFVDFCNKEFPGLYAIFFSVYKGNNKESVMSSSDVEEFFRDVKPLLEERLLPESLALFQETIDEKCRLLQGIRFPQNNVKTCYLSLSERVYDWEKESHCSHLYRDNVIGGAVPHEKCLYGCNRRLVSFNQEVEQLMRANEVQ